MLQNLNKMMGMTIRATDGEIGTVADFYFDDQEWTIRYLVVDTGPWLVGRKVLLLPGQLGHPDWAAEEFPVTVTMERVRNSPDIDTRKPVSRQHEQDLHTYYGWTPYWGVGPFSPMGGMGPGMYPGVPAPVLVTTEEESSATEKKKEDPALRSAAEVIGYHIQAGHGSIGHVEDFLVDDDGWTIRYLSIDTRNWWPGKRVLIGPLWVNRISWAERKIYVDLDRQVIKNGPEYDPFQPVSREYEEKLSDYYCKPKYWKK